MSRLSPQRLDAAEELLAAGHSPTSAARRLATDIGCSERQSWRYIAAVRERWSGEETEARPARRQQLRVMLQRCFRDAVAGGQLTAAVRACRELALLDGLHEPTELRVEHGTLAERNLHRILSMPVRDKVKYRRELLAKRKAKLAQKAAAENRKPARRSAKKGKTQ